MPRTFNGTSDFIAVGAPGALTPSVPIVVAAIVFPTSVTGFRTIVTKTQIDGGFTAGWALIIDGGKIDFPKLGAADVLSSAITLSTDKWYLIGAYATSTNVRFFAYDYSADTFTAENISDSNAFRGYTGTTAALLGKFVNGSGVASSFFAGDIEIAGAWIGGTATDDQIHNLAFDRAAWFEFGNPSALWALDQQSTSQKVVDEQQNANESSISGTSVSTRSVPLWTPGIAPVSDAGEAATIDTPFIASTTAVFAPTVDPSGAATVTVPFIASGTTAFAPTVASESVQAPFISATTTVFAPTVTSSSAATIDLPFITSTTNTFSPTLVHLDTTPPVLKLVGAYRSKITLVYDEAVDPATPMTSEFAVTVNGVANTVTGLAVSGSTVTLTLTTPVAAGNRVHVTYAP